MNMDMAVRIWIRVFVKGVKMDLREKKTIRNIQNAFLKLRAKKPLERITIRELAEAAEISKATFYLHYKDIYDLSEQMQNDMVRKMFSGIRAPDLLFSDPVRFAYETFQIFSEFPEVTGVLFSGAQFWELPHRVERTMKEYIFQEFPELEHDADFNIGISQMIYGAYYAYVENYKEFGVEKVMEKLSRMAVKFYEEFSYLNTKRTR